MAKAKPVDPGSGAVPKVTEHDHPHGHPAHQHVLPDHAHSHEHDLFHIHEEVPEHEHALCPLMPHAHETAKHEHRDLRGHLRGAVRALLTVIETGNLNYEQVKAIHAVRVIIGDSYGTACQHENAVYEEGDVLICQDCREVVTPTPAGEIWLTERKEDKRENPKQSSSP